MADIQALKKNLKWYEKRIKEHHQQLRKLEWMRDKTKEEIEQMTTEGEPSQ